MKKVLFLLTVISLATMFGCNQPSTETTTATATDTKTVTEPVVNTDSIVSLINTKRKNIEDSLGEPIIIETSNLREKIKQKWQKIHFYTSDNNVVRIKTYPYPSVTKRTEEFYLENNMPILVVIEDDGSGERGKQGEQIDKLYYFDNGQVIKEVSSGKETEYTVKDSDAEELLSELKEYLEIFAARTAK